MGSGLRELVSVLFIWGLVWSVGSITVLRYFGLFDGCCSCRIYWRLKKQNWPYRDRP